MNLTPAATERYGELVETVSRRDVQPHPLNYRQHPPGQLAHLVASVRAHGFYRPVVLARDGTILAGHGLVLAADELGIEELPAIRLDLDPQEPRALQVLVGDNEIAHLSERDDRALSELLLLVHEESIESLLGTGFDESLLGDLLERSGVELGSGDEGTERFGEFPESSPSDGLVLFQCGAYRGRVSAEVYASFGEAFRAHQVQGGAELLDDVLREWLHV